MGAKAAFMAGALSVLPVLQACMGGDGDSPYTIPAGETFETLQLEVDADGSILLLAQAAMYYSHENPLHEYDKAPQRRNLQTFIYRRSKGVWTATPFKNLQRNDNTFPALLPDTAGRFHALIWDSPGVNRFVFEEGQWTAGKAVTLPPYFQQMRMFGKRNWTRHSHIGMENDSSFLFISSAWGEGASISSIPKGASTFLDTSNFSPLAFHMDRFFRGTIGSEQPDYGKSGMPGFEARLVYYHWRPGAASAEKAILGGLEGNDCFFHPYQGRTALYLSGRKSIRIIPLDVDGYPGKDIFQSRALQPGTDTAKAAEMIFAPDSAGCVHGFDNYMGQGPSNSGFTHWNTCSGNSMDTLAIPRPDARREYFTYEERVRIGPSGNPVVAFILREGGPNPGIGYTGGYDPTWLYLAELREGRWVLEAVAGK